MSTFIFVFVTASLDARQPRLANRVMFRQAVFGAPFLAPSPFRVSSALSK